MAVGTLTTAGVYIAQLDASPFISEVSSPITIDMLDGTTLSEGGFAKMVPGMRHGEMSAKGFQDYAVGGFYETINQADLGVSTLMSVVPNGASAVAGDPAAFVYGPVDQLDDGFGKVGDLMALSVHVAEGTVFAFGPTLHPLASRSATANGTAVAQAGPTAAQTLYAGLHVTSGSGGTLTVKVQSDDASGFPSSTDRIAFTATTGPTFELKSVAGNFSSETHLRAQWTITAGTFSFVVVCAVVNTP